MASKRPLINDSEARYWNNGRPQRGAAVKAADSIQATLSAPQHDAPEADLERPAKRQRTSPAGQQPSKSTSSKTDTSRSNTKTAKPAVTKAPSSIKETAGRSKSSAKTKATQHRRQDPDTERAKNTDPETLVFSPPTSTSAPGRATRKRISSKDDTTAPPTSTPALTQASRKRAASKDDITAPTPKRRAAAKAKPTAKPPTPIVDHTSLGHDPVLLKIAQALTHREPLGQKSKPQGLPSVWAAGREELCETLPYYKSYHGGCYMNGGTVYSFMLDGAAQVREYMSEDVVICRAGGHMEADGGAGMLQARDCSMMDAQPQAVLNNLRQHNPVVIICGNKNAAAAVEMPHRFCVLGWYMPTHIWSEKVVGKKGQSYVSVRYRFERLGRSTPSWHSVKQPSLTADQAAVIPRLESLSCQHCSTQSPAAFLSGWMCLNASCEYFWVLPDGKAAPHDALLYHPSFLTHTSNNTSQEAPFDVNPGVPQFGQHVGDNLQYINTRGIVCPECGRCNQRYKFTGWECGSMHCDWRLIPEQRLVTAAGLQHNPWDIVSYGAALTKTSAKSIVKVEVAHTHNYKVLRYTLPGVEGSIIHAKANRTVVEEKGGPNDMFEAMQIQDLGLIRRMFGSDPTAKDSTLAVTDAFTSEGTVDDEHALKPRPNDLLLEQSPMSKGDPQTPVKQLARLESITPASHASSTNSREQTEEIVSNGRMSSFSMNFGMPYKFVAGGDSQSFDTAAWPIRACRSRLNWALRTLLGVQEVSQQFNELLAIGYLERQRIGFHDDGEAGLGPVIASLSLGAAATMAMRLKAKYFSGVSKAGVFTCDTPLPLEILRASGNANMTESDWQARLAASDKLKLAKESKEGNFNQRCKQIAKDLKLKNKIAQPLLDLHLTHGDIVVMQGEDLQKYFEHAVEPHGSLRFALTCRQILPAHLTPDQKPSYEVLPDTYGYDGSQIRVAGDADVLHW